MSWASRANRLRMGRNQNVIKILEDLAYNPTKRAAFQQDPESFVEQYEALTEYEKHLLVERDAAAVEGYLRNGPSLIGDGAVYAASTVIVVAIAAILILACVPHPEPAGAAAKRFDSYWHRITDRAQTLAS